MREVAINQGIQHVKSFKEGGEAVYRDLMENMQGLLTCFWAQGRLLSKN